MGMHRSGTTCLAGVLRQSGLFLGNPIASSTQENILIQRLHDDILKFNSCKWDYINHTNFTWDGLHRHRRNEIIQAYNEHNGTWGFKDPRTLLLLSFWLEVLQPRFVGTIRHPISVANSLIKRDMERRPHIRILTEEECLELWIIYNKQLLYWWNIYKFPILDFDQPEQQYKNALKKVITWLGLPTIDITYFDNTKRHWRLKSSSLPPEVELLYEELKTIARDSTNAL